MLRPRIIPCLLIHNKGLVKTQKFKNAKYVGDPLNAVRIFNEKEVDELMIVDIDNSVLHREPDFDRIKKLAYECRMPLTYGGGVRTVEHAMKIINCGAEKVAISSAAIQNPEIITKIAEAVGVQSVVVVLDVKKKIFGGYDVYIHNGKKNLKIDPVKLAIEFERLGAGEVVINSIDNDGMMSGYDLKLAEKIRNAVSIPMTILGGSGNLEHMKQAVNQLGIIGLAAGSQFVFKGKYRAVLIDYPSFEQRGEVYSCVYSPTSRNL